MSTAIGGGGSAPVRIASRWSSPESASSSPAAASGSSHVIVRSRSVVGFVTKPTLSDARPQLPLQLAAPAVAQHALRRVVARRARDAAARVRARAAQVQAADGGRVAGEVGRRAHEQQLGEVLLALEDR